MQDFDSLYAGIHQSLRENVELVRGIYQVARSSQVVDRGLSRRLYFSCGIHGGIHLGVDLSSRHKFADIIAKMRLLYELTDGGANLLRVYARLDGMKGIVSEDLSCGGKRKLNDRIFGHGKRVLGYLQLVFDGDNREEFSKTTFTVWKGEYEAFYVIADLDHLFVRPELRELYETYKEQYETDTRFLIPEI